MVVVSPEVWKIPLAPTVATIIVASGRTASLLGVNDVEAELAEPPATVVVELGARDAVKPECGDAPLEKEKTIGTPGWLVLSVAVTVTGALPAMNCVGLPVTVAMLVPSAREYATHVGPGYDAEEPPSMMVVVNAEVGGAAFAGDATESAIVPRFSVSLKPGASEPVKVSAEVVCTGFALR